MKFAFAVALLTWCDGFRSLEIKMPRSLSHVVSVILMLLFELLSSIVYIACGLFFPMCITLHFDEFNLISHLFDQSLIAFFKLMVLLTGLLGSFLARIFISSAYIFVSLPMQSVMPLT